jgi:hypothetical protein
MVRYAILIYEPGATKLSGFFFFSKSDPQEALLLSLDVKCDQETHENMMSPIMASI